MTSPLKREARWIRAIIGVGIFGFLIFFSFYPRLTPIPFCGFNVLTGLPCPLCGGTRAAHALLHGNVSLALYLNPLAIVVIGLMVTIALLALVEAALGRPLANWAGLWRRWHRPLPLILIVGLLIWWPFHIGTALHKPKTELVNLGNPFAKACQAFTGSEAK
jgi:hypothetical protein